MRDQAHRPERDYTPGELPPLPPANPSLISTHAHRPEPGFTFAELFTGAAFGALALVVALICYVMLCVFLAAFGHPVAP